MHVKLALDYLGYERWKPVDVALCPALLNYEVLALHPTQLAKTLPESMDPALVAGC